MGGIEVDKSSSTKVKGLYAVGECANHRVHGANRLGGNSLLEIIVFGKQAGESAAEYVSQMIKECSQTGVWEQEVSTLVPKLPFGNADATIDFYKIREELGDIFYKNVGISRDKETLSSTLQKVEEYILDLPKMGAKDNSQIYNTNRIEFLEFQNMLELSRLVLMGAISRQESRGAHYRSDFVDEDKKFEMHTIVDKDGVV